MARRETSHLESRTHHPSSRRRRRRRRRRAVAKSRARYPVSRDQLRLFQKADLDLLATMLIQASAWHELARARVYDSLARSLAGTIGQCQESAYQLSPAGVVGVCTIPPHRFSSHTFSRHKSASAHACHARPRPRPRLASTLSTSLSKKNPHTEWYT
ncbi:hypothetical protein IE81DRAFT_233626 [Ceraceosorus guamensis]|uniref:Uncharacterized protein n=1 Tax=Ceraceosorus guamensis TaxID=1522189 RepID=A0A316VV34_9BASI|nr:hypothetical protein IE81DRAFT_233626 [Ceraceosorus guamensis]PWN40293.1 hypothetical protein IE81DRAFT_233626 [Ceraceosorus guamensis]